MGSGPARTVGALVAAALLLAAGPLRAQLTVETDTVVTEPPADAPSPCEGLPIEAVLLQGCEGSRCDDERTRAELLALSDMRPGDVYRQATAKAADARLLEVGYFHRVVHACVVTAGRGTVTFYGVPIPIIRELRVEGNQFVLKDELRKRIFLRSGARLMPEAPDGAQALRRQAETLRKFYEREGFVDTAVDIDTRPVGKDQLEVVIRVAEGRKNRVERRHVAIDMRPQPPARLDDRPASETGELVEAPFRCPPFTDGELKRAADLPSVDVYTERKERDIRNKLREFLQAHGFIDPRVEVRFDPATATLHVNATHDGCYVIRFLERDRPAPGDEGFKPVEETEDLLSVLTFGNSGSFDFDEADYGRRLLQSDLENQGLLFADVTLDYRRFDRRRASPGERLLVSDTVRGVITYLITHGSVTEIRSIGFPGATVFDEDTLHEAMETRVYDFFGPGGYLQVEQMVADLRKIRSLYQDKGYFRMRFRGFSTVAQPQRRVERVEEATVYVYAVEDMGFRARKPDGENVLYIDVPIDEGTQSRIESVEITGSGALGLDAVRGALQLDAGSPFSHSRLKRAFQRLRTLYLEAGHPAAEVTVKCSGTSPAVPMEACVADEVTSESVALRFEIEEGPEVRVGDRFWMGNFDTEDSVIDLDLPSEGLLYTPASVAEAERKLRALGVFNTVRIDVIGLDEQPVRDRVALVARLEEADSRFLDFAIGFESISRQGEDVPSAATSVLSNSVAVLDRQAGFQGRALPLSIPDLLVVLQAEYIDLNLLGYAKELHIPLKYGLSASGIPKGDLFRLLAFAPSYIDRRLAGLELNFRVTPFFLYDEVTDVFDQIEGGIQFEVSKRLFDHLLTSLSYEVSGISTREPPGSAIVTTSTDFSTPSLQNKVSPRIAWDGLDNPINPTEGFYVGGSFAYIAAIDLDTRGFTNFLKGELEGKGVFNIRRFLIVANYVHFGASASFDADNLPLTERFKLGGNKGVRGYGDGEMIQYESDGSPRKTLIGGDFVLNGTTELRLPIFPDLGSFSLWTAVFFDWGALADDISQFYDQSFRTSAGLGLRLLLYGQVPLRLDYGIKLDRRCLNRDAAGDCVEEENLGELSFGILYTF